ncbi:ABC transporter ATP-binding protein [Variovorax sp. PBL-E5]|uniref:ABC transporter ATP-binding protein n=1 Tax=Variovorax sp. PBL-E5 TaxID=434014 RepID=UPI00131893F7|nr:ABC transporter ATP-binding protein [Variovorax sp. PBL-E5]VTU34232.1 putative ABC transporter ATP-binding protein YbbL [Variovorax sp. PBL-E5]
MAEQGGATPLLVLRGLRSVAGGPFDLEIAAGECVGLLGKSGSGKSALLRSIADLDPGDGEVELAGRRRESWPAPQWRRRVVYQAAEPAWWAADAAAHFHPGDAALLHALMPALGLAPDVLRTEIARLSTGERQRLALIRSLAAAPEVLLLDEPTASLDASSAAAMEALLCRRLAAGLAILMVTHSTQQAQRMGGRLFEMRDGALHPS